MAHTGRIDRTERPRTWKHSRNATGILAEPRIHLQQCVQALEHPRFLACTGGLNIIASGLRKRFQITAILPFASDGIDNNN